MADIENFDLDRSTEQAWETFTDRLDEVLSVMDDTSDLTISVVRAGAADEPRICYSAVASGSVAAVLTSDADPERLRALGWQDAGEGRYRVTMDQEQTGDLARLTVKTLGDVLGVLHPVFLEPDQLAEILTPGGEAQKEADVPLEELAVATPTSHQHLDDMLVAALTEINGHPPLRNAQGDLAIRVGSAVVFARCTEDYHEVVLFSPLVHDVAGRSRAAEVLNDLNVEARYCRFALHRDRVFAQISVFARPFVRAHLRTALEHITKVADGLDDELAARLSGRTTYPG